LGLEVWKQIAINGGIRDFPYTQWRTEHGGLTNLIFYVNLEFFPQW